MSSLRPRPLEPQYTAEKFGGPFLGLRKMEKPHPSPMEAISTDYHYFGLLLGKAKVSLALLSAVLPTHGTHVAVWLGVSNNARSAWVQAGVAEVAGGHPGVYVETKSPGHYSLRSWPGSSAVVRVQRRGMRYRVLVGRHRSPWVVISGARRIACMEILGAASGTAQIDGRLIQGEIF